MHVIYQVYSHNIHPFNISIAKDDEIIPKIGLECLNLAYMPIYLFQEYHYKRTLELQCLAVFIRIDTVINSSKAH